MPAKSSPITAGWPRRSNASPANFPASSMIANTVKKRATSIPPAAPRTRSRPAAKAHGGGLKRLRRLGMEVEGVVEQRQIDALAVLGLDHDLPRRGAPRDPDLLGLGRKTDVDRKSTRLNSSHDQISYAVFCLKKKKKTLNKYMSIHSY